MLVNENLNGKDREKVSAVTFGCCPKEQRVTVNSMIKVNDCFIKVAANGQGLLQGWNSLVVLPGTAAD